MFVLFDVIMLQLFNTSGMLCSVM